MCKECLKGDCECTKFVIHVEDIDFFNGKEFDSIEEAQDIFNEFLSYVVKYKKISSTSPNETLKVEIKEKHVEK